MKWTLKNVALLLAPITAMAFGLVWPASVMACVIVAILFAFGYILVLAIGDDD